MVIPEEFFRQRTGTCFAGVLLPSSGATLSVHHLKDPTAPVPIYTEPNFLQVKRAQSKTYCSPGVSAAAF